MENCFICGKKTYERQLEFIHDKSICVSCTHEYTNDEILEYKNRENIDG